MTCITDGTTRVDETLSPSGRVLRRRVSAAANCNGAPSSPTEDISFGFASNGDSPAWSKPTAGGSVTTYLGGPGGLQVIDVAGTPTYPIHSPHGDIIGTTNAAGTFTLAPAVDEFGVGLPATNRLGWLGAHNRFITHEGLDLFRMGVRVYDPRLGRFLQVDPIEGGSCNDYDYVCGDPVNGLDIGGTWGLCWHCIADAAVDVATGVGVVAGLTACIASIGCGVVAAGGIIIGGILVDASGHAVVNYAAEGEAGDWRKHFTAGALTSLSAAACAVSAGAGCLSVLTAAVAAGSYAEVMALGTVLALIALFRFIAGIKSPIGNAVTDGSHSSGGNGGGSW